ncbi:MAG: DUF1428 domain-containing protein [Paracoccus sp. (in: a-proteobacteria)]
MAYYTGMIAAVPTANRQKYLDHAKLTWPLFRSYGATRMVETWGVDIRPGKVTDYLGAVQATADEGIVYSWIEWPDQAAADAAWDKMQTDPAMQALPPLPFDGSRMIFGGFAPVFAAGQTAGGGYYQGFILAVPAANRDAYVKMAADAWGMFERYGCLGLAENWATDVPHGQKTDFYRATRAEAGEDILFSWTVWPNRETCDSAAERMQADMQGQDMPEMPFDGMRMIWAGFEPIFESYEA